jgi:hypothetical protein
VPKHSLIQSGNRWWQVISATGWAESLVTDVLEKPSSDAVLAEREINLKMLAEFVCRLNCLLGVAGARHLPSHMNNLRCK